MLGYDAFVRLLITINLISASNSTYKLIKILNRIIDYRFIALIEFN